MTDAYCTPYSVHPGGDKLYKDLKKTFWWLGLKKEVAEFFARCLYPEELQDSMGTTLKMSTAFHPAIDGQTERTIQTLEEMLRACVMEFGEFEVDDKILLKVSLMRGVLRFGKRGKLSKRFIGPYDILDRIGVMAYHFALPPTLNQVHNVFHMSQLRKYISDLTHVLEVKTIELDDALTYVEIPKQILDQKVRKTRNGETILLKVLWSNHNMEEATWVPEEVMKERYPHLFEHIGCKSELEKFILCRYLGVPISSKKLSKNEGMKLQ
ncbi:uncharacterized protein LOC141628674 [Silene latifolia]|uniref:uncharacterized protein LOC141628674 n=1 Tax=Silene latifolia TaxID=37657 RepID=UPI003D76B77F